MLSSNRCPLVAFVRAETVLDALSVVILMSLRIGLPWGWSAETHHNVPHADLMLAPGEHAPQSIPCLFPLDLKARRILLVERARIVRSATCWLRQLPGKGSSMQASKWNANVVALSILNGLVTGGIANFILYAGSHKSEIGPFTEFGLIRAILVVLVCTLNTLLFFRIHHHSKWRFATRRPRLHAAFTGAWISWAGTPVCGLISAFSMTWFTIGPGDRLALVGVGTLLFAPVSLVVGALAGLILTAMAPRQNSPAQ